LTFKTKGIIPEDAILIEKSENFKEFDDFMMTSTEFYACTAFRNEDKQQDKANIGSGL